MKNKEKLKHYCDGIKAERERILKLIDKWIDIIFMFGETKVNVKKELKSQIKGK